MLKRILMILVVCFIVMPSLMGCIAQKVVEPGFVGVKVNKVGSKRGVQNFTLCTGRVWYGSWKEDVLPYPVFFQTYTWCASDKEGSSDNESITFNSIEGNTMNVDVSGRYRVIEKMVPKVFTTYRKSADEITSTIIRSEVRDSFNRVASQMKCMDIMGPKKTQLLADVLKDLNTRLMPKGFEFESITMNCTPRVDKNVKDAINAVVEASQRATEAEQKVRQSTAEANQEIAKARGTAQAILMKAQAQANANRLVRASITPDLVKWQAIDKWNGVLPQVTGNAIPFVQLGGK
jgi:regulator of protease activity HflC (stomatin/prohibitin superfamily)